MEDHEYREEPAMEEREAFTNPYAPIKLGPSIPNYYGDYVRQIFMGCGAVMLVFAPFLAASDPALLPFEIAGAIVFAILGAMTNPNNQLSSLANAIGAGAAVVIYELLALNLYFEERYLAFVQREGLAIAFLMALYFSLKTFRNMVSDRIGKRNTVGRFFTRRNRGDGD